MRSGTHLRPVSKPEEGSVRVTKENEPEVRGNWLESTRLPNLIGDMERMMSEMLHRPFMETGMMPFRGLMHEIGRVGGMSPSVDIFEEGGAIVVKADLPGLKKDEISVKLVDNILEISGEKKTQERIDKRDYLRLERTYGTFSRTLRLPDGLDAENVAARFDEGVLEIRIPKLEDKRTVKKINIK